MEGVDQKRAKLVWRHFKKSPLKANFGCELKCILLFNHKKTDFKSPFSADMFNLEGFKDWFPQQKCTVLPAKNDKFQKKKRFFDALKNTDN